MMSKRSRQELTKEIYPRYLKANKAEKIKILDEFTLRSPDTTGNTPSDYSNMV